MCSTCRNGTHTPWTSCVPLLFCCTPKLLACVFVDFAVLTASKVWVLFLVLIDVVWCCYSTRWMIWYITFIFLLNLLIINMVQWYNHAIATTHPHAPPSQYLYDFVYMISGPAWLPLVIRLCRWTLPFQAFACNLSGFNVRQRCSAMMAIRFFFEGKELLNIQELDEGWWGVIYSSAPKMP